MAMGKKLGLMSITAVALLLLTVPAFCQDQQSDPLAFTPTGDALWDRYAQALLERVGTEGNGSFDRWALPEELVVSWETQFGSDPRYWQLYAWNSEAIARNVPKETGSDGISVQPGLGRDRFRAGLEEGQQKGVTDAVTEMLLYNYNRRDLDGIQGNFETMSAEERQLAGVPEFENNIERIRWFEEQEFALVEALVDAWPDESWVWFTSARKQFEYGNWDEGLEDLRRGSSAANNRLPMPFPASFVIGQISQGKDCGSKVAAGSIYPQMVAWPLMNYIKVKDNIKNQQVRLSMGAPLSEMEAWHLFTCKFGAMENAPLIHKLVALVISDVWVKHVLIRMPGALDERQREALWRYYTGGREVKGLVKYKLPEVEPGVEGLVQVFEEVYAKYGLDYDPADPRLPAEIFESQLIDFVTETDKLSNEETARFDAELIVALLLYQFESLAAEYGEISNEINERFLKLAEFDAATFSWPE